MEARTSFQRGLKPLSLTVAVLDSFESSGIPVSHVRRVREKKNESKKNGFQLENTKKKKKRMRKTS